MRADPRVLDLFSDASCDISADHVVRFETDFVQECLETGEQRDSNFDDLATRQVMTHLGLAPMAGSGGGSRARRFNQDAAFQIAAGVDRMFFTRPAVADGMGGIDSGITYSLHALLLCDDLAGMLRLLWNGVSVDDEHLAPDLTRSVGPKGNHLAQKHSAVHFQDDYWDSRYFGARFPRSNSPAVPDRDLVERIDDDLRGILATHSPEPLPEPLRKEIRGILERFEGR